LRTLEPQLVACNDLATMNKIFNTSLADKQAMIDFMIDQNRMAETLNKLCQAFQ
jgi:hypothetical protein